MNIENQVANLKLSQRIEELEIKGESEWYWIIETTGDFIENRANLYSIHNDHLEATYSAYTVAELGEMLPGVISEYWDLECSKQKKSITKPKLIACDCGKGEVECGKIIIGTEMVYVVCYISSDGGCLALKHLTESTSEANARAKMLIWLKENNYL